jgi:hypothetical protein
VTSSAASIVAPPAKTAKRPNASTSGALKQALAPVDRGAQRPLTSGDVARAASEDVERLGKAGVQLLGAEQRAAGRRKLYRERQPVETAADICDRASVGRCQLEAPIPAADALEEERAGGGLLDRRRLTAFRKL